ncbi:MAG TPA: dihydrofolate reductase family protein [Pseudonocardiaceae bacterium]|jgi:dihydrofolate reductase|nr:dihydrofolate reductase family protein [Pseudonocardiaceae bacterium]
MRRIVAGLFSSLDGVVESPNEWAYQYFTDEMLAEIGAGVTAADAVLVGRRTYREFVGRWAGRDDSPMATFLNESPKYVVSTTLRPDELTWASSTLLDGDLGARLGELKRQSGKNIQVPGSPRLVRALLRDGLLDELHLSICPLVVGTGFRLFDELTARIPLELTDSTTSTTGVLGLTYRPA